MPPAYSRRWLSVSQLTPYDDTILGLMNYNPSLWATSVWTLFEHRRLDEVFKAPFYQYSWLLKTVRFRSAALEWVASSLEFIKVWGDFFMFKSLVTFGYIIFLIIDICSHTIIVFSCSMWIIMLRLLNIWMTKVVLNILFTLSLIFCQWCTCESKFMCRQIRDVNLGRVLFQSLIKCVRN